MTNRPNPPNLPNQSNLSPKDQVCRHVSALHGPLDRARQTRVRRVAGQERDARVLHAPRM